MKPLINSLRSVINIGLVFIPSMAVAQANPLSLQPGIYVLSTSTCKAPPLAAIKSWDGAGFSGPHASNCTTKVLNRHHDRFKVTTACTANGDGSPARSTYVESFFILRLSRTHFEIFKNDQTQGDYRWCEVAIFKEKP